MTSIKSAMKMVGSRPLLLLTAVLFTTTTNALAPLTPGTIRVCQNKHCCKRNPQLSQIIANLVDGAVTVEASGCLSHCEEGPNVEIQWNGHESSTTLVTGVTDATTAAVQIELALKLAKPIPKLLVAASNVMERAINSQVRTTYIFAYSRRRHFLESLFRTKLFRFCMVLFVRQH
jgi:hypothetical protein